MMGFFKKTQAQTITAPVSGTLMALEDVNDPVFAQKMMGEGIAILAEGDTIYAPADGKLMMIAETKHAFGLQLSNGLELMVHVGLETVNLNGKGFEVLASVGESVKQGTPILKIDLPFMKEQQISLCTPVILLNHQEHPFSRLLTQGAVSAPTSVLFEIKS